MQGSGKGRVNEESSIRGGQVLPGVKRTFLRGVNGSKWQSHYSCLSGDPFK